MRHTLTAVFTTRGEAQHMLNRLLAAGYSHADAALSIAPQAGRATGKQLHVFGIVAWNFFARLFGPVSGDHLASNPGTLASARHMLTFTTESEAEVKHATEIVGRFIPVDGAEIHAWPSVGVPGATDAARRPDTVRRDPDKTSPDMDEDGYHRKESGYALAIADDEASRGYHDRYRRWKAATAALQAKWTLRHPGELPPWEKFKDAVLHGWGRISLGSDDTEATFPPRTAKNSLAKPPSHVP